MEASDVSIKLVFLGNSGVGKTSLINKWITGSFSPTTRQTIGASHYKKNMQVGEKSVVVCVWDTAGQEMYMSLAPLYTRSASVAIIVASGDDVQSFEDLNAWRRLVLESNEPAPPMVLAISKKDLIDNESINSFEEKYGGNYDGCVGVSALTGECVDILFDIAVRLAIEKNPSGAIDTNNEKLVEGKKKKCC